jgi:tetratricopeptide (TPR) repeat protein
MKSKNDRSSPPCAIAIAIGLSILSACASKENKAYGEFCAHGMAYDQAGTAIDGMEISLNGFRKAKSDHMGRFSFDSLAPGEYGLRATMDGFEEFSGKIRLSSPADVIYLSLFSVPDLLRGARESMRLEKWPEALACLERALKADPGNRRAQYLKALALSSGKNPHRDRQAARAVLEGMLASGFSDPSLDALLKELSSGGGSPPPRSGP